jgi:hypothetical protein
VCLDTGIMSWACEERKIHFYNKKLYFEALVIIIQNLLRTFWHGVFLPCIRYIELVLLLRDRKREKGMGLFKLMWDVGQSPADFRFPRGNGGMNDSHKKYKKTLPLLKTVGCI